MNKRGGRVSAGQRQLISFARAFLADPAVLILDEATASLDIPSERLIQDALQTLLKDRTAIIIAHRLSTVAIADRVLVMEHGRIIEDDTPPRSSAAPGSSRSCTQPGRRRSSDHSLDDCGHARPRRCGGAAMAAAVEGWASTRGERRARRVGSIEVWTLCCSSPSGGGSRRLRSPRGRWV